MNENNINQEPENNSEYPKTSPLYPQPESQQSDSYPQSGYPQSGMPFPQSGYSEENKSKTWHIALVSIVVVLIVALSATLIIVLKNRNQVQNNMMMPPPPPMMMNTTPGSVVLNGQLITFDVINEDGKTYLPVKEFTAAVGYDCVVDGDLIKIIAPMEISILEAGSTQVKLEDQNGGGTTSVVITTAPFKSGDNVYIYARDVALFLKDAYVTYDTRMQTVQINVGMGSGGPGGPPPMGGGQMLQDGGQPPQGGGQMLQDGGQPPQGGGQPQQGGGQPPQGGGQPPQGGGQPPQN